MGGGFFANRLVGFDRIGEDPFKELRGMKTVNLEDLSSFSVKELKTCSDPTTARYSAALLKNLAVRSASPSRVLPP